jgi:hypothetical protein
MAVVMFPEDDPTCNIDYIDLQWIDGHPMASELKVRDEVVVNWPGNEPGSKKKKTTKCPAIILTLLGCKYLASQAHMAITSIP